MSQIKKSKKIIFVHGKNTKPNPVEHHELLLKSLRAGIAESKFGADMEAFEGEEFILCAWSDLLYSNYEDPGTLSDAVDRLIDTSGETVHRSSANKLFIYLLRSLYLLVDRYPLLMRLLPIRHIDFMLEGTRAYLENRNGVADQVRERLSSLVRDALVDEGQDVLIVAHSLGSVIAYDVLASRPAWADNRSVELITLGSPLGLRYLQARLCGGMNVFPMAISHWVNVSAYGDMVSLDTTLRDDFERMIGSGGLQEILDIVGIKTKYRDIKGLNPHKSYGYLANPIVAGLIASWYLGHGVETNEFRT